MIRTFFTFARFVGVLCALSFLSACESPSTSDLNSVAGLSTAPVVAAPAAAGTTLNIIGGNFQIAAPSAGFSNPLLVQLLTDGVPLTGKTINFTFTTGITGTLSAASVVTDASGMASITLIAGASGGTVGIQSSYNAVNANFTESIVDQSGSTIAIFSGNSQSAAVNTNVTNQLKVVVTNTISGLPAANIIVTFLVTAGNGQINGISNSLNITTDALGVAAINFKVGTLAGNNTIKALIASNVAQFVNFSETGTTSPTSFNLTQSTVTSNVSSMVANGTDIATLTFTLKDAYGNILSPPTGAVVFSVTNGTLLGSVSNVGNGTYTQILLAPSTGGGTIITASATYNAAACSNTASINLISGAYSVANSTVTTSVPTVLSDGTSYATITVTLKDSFNNQLTGGGQTVVISRTGGGVLLGGVTDLANGTYTQLLKSTTLTGSATVSATVNTVSIPSSTTVTFIAGAANAGTSTLAVTPSVVAPDNTSTSTIILTTEDVYGNVRSATSSGGSPVVTFTTTLGTLIGSAVDNGNGTFQQTIKSNTAGTATVKAVIAGVNTTASKLIYFNTTTPPNLSYSLVKVIGASTQAADGTSTTQIKVTLKDNTNTQFTTGGNAVVISATGGTLIGSVSDNTNGTYTQLIQSPASSMANVAISATVDGSAIVNTSSMNFYGAISLATSTLNSTSPSIEATGATTTTIVLQAKDLNGIVIPVGGVAGLAFSTTAGTLLGSVLDNSNGTYTQSLQSTAVGNTATISATKSATPFSATASVVFFVANNWSGLTMDCTADDATGTFGTAATSIAKRLRLWGNNVIVDNGTLTINTRSAAGYCPGTFNFSNFIVRNNGIITHTAIGTGTTIYNTEFTTATLSLDNTAKIDVSGKGLYPLTAGTCRVPAGTTAAPSAQDTAVGWQTGYTQCTYGGGSHGGESGTYYSYAYSGSNTYGNLFQPTDPGASSGAYGGGSAGGGIVKITVSGTATIDGSIRADGNGSVGTSSGAGAGGSAWLNVGTLAGAGYVSVNGGGMNGYSYGGPGGGGRMAIYYTNLNGNFSMPTNLFTGLRAYGGLSSTYSIYAAAGTIYLKGSTQTYGDLIVNNNGGVSGDFANFVYPRTTIKSPTMQTPTAVTANTITKATVFQDNYKTDSPYVNWFINPNTAQNTTLTRMDDTYFKVTSADANSATITTGSMTSAPLNATTSTNFEMMLVFDHVEVRGKGHLNGPFILALNGDISSNNTNQATIDGYISSARGFEFDNSSILWTSTGQNTSGASFNLDLIPLRYNTRNYSFTNGYYTFSNNIIANNLSFTNSNITGSVLRTNPSFTLSGALSLSASTTLNHSPASSAVSGAEYSLEITSTGATIDATSAIDVTSLGYYPGTANFCRGAGNQDASSASYYGGGAHGGWGVALSSTTSYQQAPYDSVYSPYYSGGACNYGAQLVARGGGIIRLDVGNGTLTNNGVIKSNGSVTSPCSGSNSLGSAGGAIYINSGTLSGTGSISANGGDGSCGYSASYANVGGSGGRIAVYYNTLSGNFAYGANMIANISAIGGGTDWVNAGYTDASPGTIFMKNKSQTYGDLIIKGNTNSPRPCIYGNCGATLGSPARVATTSLSTNTAGFASANTLKEYGQYTNELVGMYFVPNTAQGGTPTMADKTMFLISSLAGSVLTTNSSGMTAVAVSGNTGAFVPVFNNIEITNKGVLSLTENAITLNGDISSGDATSFVMNGSVQSIPGILELPTNVAISITGDAGTNTAGNTFPGFITSSIASVSVSGTGVWAVNGNQTIPGSLTMTGGTINGNSSAVLNVGGSVNMSGSSTINMGTTGTSPNLIVTGNISLTGTSSITPATPFYSQASNRLYITANNITIGSGCSINGDARGGTGSGVASSHLYFNGVNYTVGFTGSTPYYAGGSHGGVGGNYVGAYDMFEPYDNLFQPIEVGMSGDTWSSYFPTNGGGAIRLGVTGTLQVDGTLTANGQYQTTPGVQQPTGAGGSIWVQTATLQGTGTITANGGSQSWASNNMGTGSGGRIALYYTTAAGNFSYPANMITNVNAFGGISSGTSPSTANGAAGTIYLKSNAQTYGDLLINNNGNTANPTCKTLIRAPALATNTGLSNANKTLTKPGQFGYLITGYNQYPLLNRFMGFFINPNTAQNATTRMTDDTFYKITASTDNTITTASDMTVGTSAAGGSNFRTAMIFDNLEVRGKANLDASNINIQVNSGDLSSNNTTGFSLDGTITANVVDLNGGVWTNTGNGVSTGATYRCNLTSVTTPTLNCP